jgi:dynein light intermediate chain 2, cytosolic
MGDSDDHEVRGLGPPTTSATASIGGDIFAVATQEAQILDRDPQRTAAERHLVFVGARGAGKSTIINRLLERDEPTKPTLALDYVFGRRTRGHSTVRDLGHMWEIGGGPAQAALLDVPLTARSLPVAAVCIVVDLSAPHDVFATVESWLARIRSRCDDCLAEMAARAASLASTPTTAVGSSASGAAGASAAVASPRAARQAAANGAREIERIKRNAWAPFGSEHPDRALLSPVVLPILIVGSKYDVFQNLESEKRKIVCRTLRFLAHTHGASLLFISQRDEALMARCRTALSALLFGTPGLETYTLEHSKPLNVPVGVDNLQQIGLPRGKGGDVSAGEVSSVRNPMDLWRRTYASVFPPPAAAASDGASASTDGEGFGAPEYWERYREPLVDEMRAQKDVELDRYRKQSERRMRELAAKADARERQRLLTAR